MKLNICDSFWGIYIFTRNERACMGNRPAREVKKVLRKASPHCWLFMGIFERDKNINDFHFIWIFKFYVLCWASEGVTGPTQDDWGRGTAQEVTTGEGICHARPAVHTAGAQLNLTTTPTPGSSPETWASETEKDTVCFKMNTKASQQDFSKESLESNNLRSELLPANVRGRTWFITVFSWIQNIPEGAYSVVKLMRSFHGTRDLIHFKHPGA